MRAKVPGIEKPLAIRFHEKGVGVVSGMVYKIGRHRERIDADQLPVFQMGDVLEDDASRGEDVGGSEDGFRRLADQEVCFLGQSISQSVMVAVGMRDDHAEE